MFTKKSEKLVQTQALMIILFFEPAHITTCSIYPKNYSKTSIGFCKNVLIRKIYADVFFGTNKKLFINWTLWIADNILVTESVRIQRFHCIQLNLDTKFYEQFCNIDSYFFLKADNLKSWSCNMNKKIKIIKNTV